MHRAKQLEGESFKKVRGREGFGKKSASPRIKGEKVKFARKRARCLT